MTKMTHDQLVASGLHECASDCPPARERYTVAFGASKPRNADGSIQTDPRAALAEAAYEDRPPLGKRPVPQPPRLRKEWEAWAGRMQPRLAERGVLLVTEERLRAALSALGYDYPPPDLDFIDAAAIFAALSGEADTAERDYVAEATTPEEYRAGSGDRRHAIEAERQRTVDQPEPGRKGAG